MSALSARFAAPTVQPLTSLAHAVAVLAAAEARQGLIEALDQFLARLTRQETS